MAIGQALCILGTMQRVVYSFSHLILIIPYNGEAETRMWELTYQGHTAFL